ncbi:hypothetical protein AVEN_208958-1 [Araneus ventricosus]|uniref:Uncharacterized protein n=1 Tax=Araneus ventricosus TaxID=182803 RepID=A0A4Y2G944_ARAVE|nr:hypothetical protein AVEN_208958-1 [Araneus ventricosus]
MDDSANASELAKKITVAEAVEWSKSAWRYLYSGLVVKCFASCGANSGSEEESPSDDVIQQVEPTMTAQQT